MICKKIKKMHRQYYNRKDRTATAEIKQKKTELR